MTTRAEDWYAEACRRARAHGRRRRAAQASTALPELTPPVGLSDGPLGEVQSADREIGRQTARRARAVAAFAASRPAGTDRAQGEPGAMSPQRWSARPEVLRPVSEWAGRELMVALSITAEAADALLTRSLTLVQRLPGTLAALDAGALHPGHLWTMLEKVAPIADERLRAEVEAELLRWAAGRVVTPAQLGAKARREVARRDARSAARNLQRALKERGIHLRPHTVDGMATLTVVATMPEAQALYRALIACAETLDEADDTRTRGQKMLDCLLDLVLRPGESNLPPVQVLLTVVASVATLIGGDEPGEVDGHVVPAELIRQLLIALTARQSPPRSPAADPAAAESPAAGTTTADDWRAWQETVQEELARWAVETERRVLADQPKEAQPDEDGVPADVLDAVCRNLLDESPPAAPAPDRGQSEPEDAASAPPAPTAAALDSGRWAAADRAVYDASAAMFASGEKLAHAQRMVRGAIAADDADEAAWQDGPGGRITDAGDALTALLAATDIQRDQLGTLLASTAGGGLADRPRIALTDAVSGALLALTDLPGLSRAGTCGHTTCRHTPADCTHDLSHRTGLGPPGPTDGYRPAADLDRFMRARDRRCRFPGCRRRVPRGGELDHHHRYPDGPTSADNLAGYCTTDHRGKHQAPGWRHQLDPDGTLTVTTPTGLVAATTPPPY